METTFIADPTRLIIAALCGLAILLALIIKAKFQPLIAILIAALSIGVFAGMPVSMIGDTVSKGMGETLKGIDLLVGLGSMFGAILEISGGAERVALTMMSKFGEKRAPWALGITGMVTAIPVFFDAGLIILIPLAFSIARRAKNSLFTLSSRCWQVWQLDTHSFRRPLARCWLPTFSALTLVWSLDSV